MKDNLTSFYDNRRDIEYKINDVILLIPITPEGESYIHNYDSQFYVIENIMSNTRNTLFKQTTTLATIRVIFERPGTGFDIGLDYDSDFYIIYHGRHQAAS
jgi:hypothetical protein